MNSVLWDYRDWETHETEEETRNLPWHMVDGHLTGALKKLKRLVNRRMSLPVDNESNCFVKHP